MAQRTLIYLTGDTISFRQTRFDDIKVGEKLANGIEVFEICETTQENLRVLHMMVKTLNSWSGGRDITRTQTMYGFKLKTVIGKRHLTLESKENFINECLDLLT